MDWANLSQLHRGQLPPALDPGSNWDPQARPKAVDEGGVHMPLHAWSSILKERWD